MDNTELEVALEELENRLERLRALYEQYFMGIERIEPTVPRKDVDRRIYVLRREKIRNTAKRFKLQTIISRYNTFQQYWQRICREIEQGTYKRHVIKAERIAPGKMLTIAARRRLGRAALEAMAPEEAPSEASPAEVPSEPPVAAVASPLEVARSPLPTQAEPMAAIRLAPPPKPTSAAAPPKPGPPTTLAAAPPKPGALPPIAPAAAPKPGAPTTLVAAPPKPGAPPPIAQAAPPPKPVVQAVPPAPAKLGPPPKPSSPAAPAAPPSKLDAKPVVQASVAAPRPTFESADLDMDFLGDWDPSVPVQKTPVRRHGGGRPTPPFGESLAKPLSSATKPASADSPRPTKPGTAPNATAPVPRAVAAESPSAASAAPVPSPAPPKPVAAPARPQASPRAPTPPPAAAIPLSAPIPGASSPQKSAPTKPAAPATAPAAGSDERVRELHARLLEAKRQTQDSATVSIEGLAKSMKATETKLRAQYKNRKIDFDVVIKDGKAILKPIVR